MHQQAEAEKRIAQHWDDLKELLKPEVIVKDTFSAVLDRRVEENIAGGGLLKSTLNYGISLFIKKFSGKAENTIKQWFA